MLDLPPEGGPSSSSRRRPTSEPARGRLEIVDDALERVVDAVEFARQELAAQHAALSSRPCQRIMSHMYWWLVRVARDGSARTIVSRKLANVPDHWSALCRCVKSTRLSMNCACCSVPSLSAPLSGSARPVPNALTGAEEGICSAAWPAETRAGDRDPPDASSSSRRMASSNVEIIFGHISAAPRSTWQRSVECDARLQSRETASLGVAQRNPKQQPFRRPHRCAPGWPPRSGALAAPWRLHSQRPV